MGEGLGGGGGGPILDGHCSSPAGGGFGHFRRLMRAFGGCFERVLSSLSADKPVSHALSIVELSSQPVALKFRDTTIIRTIADWVLYLGGPLFWETTRALG